MLVAREEFKRFLDANPETLTDIQRAVRFYYLCKVGFGSRVRTPSYGVSTTAPPRMNLMRVEEELSAAHLRLAKTFIERMPYLEMIDRYDRPHTFFYVDPPYFGCENDYGKGIFNRDDFSALAERLGRVKGKWIVSLNDAPEIRAVFDGFQIRTVQTSYSLGVIKNSKKVTELLISNR